jgi:hypothetical protein
MWNPETEYRRGQEEADDKISSRDDRNRKLGDNVAMV